MNKITLKYLAAVIITIFMIIAEAKSYGQSGQNFGPSGKPVFLVYTNLHSTFNKAGSSPAFEVTRFYLGYEHNFSKSLSGRGVLDVGDPGIGGFQMSAFVKNAFLQYREDKFAVRSGMISSDAVVFIEKQWGYRYLLKTFQDEYGFNPSADLGAAIEYTPAKFISVDASVLNGEGYKRLQSDSVLKYSAGITVKPFTGFQFRVYTDFMRKDHLQNTVLVFAGYSNENFRLGLEYNLQKNSRMVANQDYSGFSAYGSLKISDKFSVLARYDYLQSATIGNDLNPWNYNKDGQMFMTGFEFSPVAGVRIAPVFSGRLPANSARPFTAVPGIYLELRL